jgi:Lar family restriction alleviation protein
MPHDGARPCPFCAEPSALRVASDVDDEFSIECEACGAIGPIADTKTAAIELWNRRRRQPA